MADIIFWLTSFFFLSFLIFNTISWLALLEEKEFKFSRVFIHLRETKRGRSLILGFNNLFKWIAIFLYGITIFWGGDFYYHILVFLIYLYLFLKSLLKIRNREIKLPRLTTNPLLIIALTFTLSILLFLFPPLDRFLWMLIIDRLSPFVLIFITSVFFVFFDFRQDAIINKAIDKLNRQKEILTIAVVGSYAKGSTKEFITRILSIKFNALENDNPFNNELGIARTILSELTPKKQIFVVEMEDYKPGDIFEMSNITRPSIAVITGINDEKVSDFGSLTKIIDSKYDVIDALPRDGIVLLSGNNPNTMTLYSRIKNKKFIYAYEDTGLASDICALNIKSTRFSISFDVRVFGKIYRFSGIKLIGAQNVENLLPGIFLGLYLGIDFSQIKKELAKLTPLPRTMDPSKSENGAILVNDTYNTHINSVRQAVSYMNLYKGKKVLVLEPLTELGKNAYQDHFDLGREIGKVCDYLFLTNDNYYKPLVLGVQNEKSLCIVQVLSPGKTAKFIKENTGVGDIVVFEGREAYNSFSLIESTPILRKVSGNGV